MFFLFIYYNSWQLTNINNNNNSNTKKTKQNKSHWNCAKEQGTPRKVQHHTRLCSKENFWEPFGLPAMPARVPSCLGRSPKIISYFSNLLFWVTKILQAIKVSCCSLFIQVREVLKNSVRLLLGDSCNNAHWNSKATARTNKVEALIYF